MATTIARPMRYIEEHMRHSVLILNVCLALVLASTRAAAAPAPAPSSPAPSSPAPSSPATAPTADDVLVQAGRAVLTSLVGAVGRSDVEGIVAELDAAALAQRTFGAA